MMFRSMRGTRASATATAAVLVALVALAGLTAGMAADKPAESPATKPDADGFVSIFNGKDLTGWDAKPGWWSVEDGALTAQSTPDKPCKECNYLIWTGGKPGDFELRLKFRMLAHNSGIQYRSKDEGKFVVSGYQADIDYGNTYTGMLYEERGRGILVKRGTKMTVQADGKKEVQGQTATDKEILDSIKKDDWNEYVITCQGNHIVQKLNGITTVDLTDNQESKRAMSGVIAFQLHAGPPMKVQFKDIFLKESK